MKNKTFFVLLFLCLIIGVIYGVLIGGSFATEQLRRTMQEEQLYFCYQEKTDFNSAPFDFTNSSNFSINIRPGSFG